MVTQLTTANFDKEVMHSDTFVIVDFWAEWCGPCKRMAPVFEEVSQEFYGRMKFCKLNTEEAPEIAQQNNIQSIPCLVIFKNGTEVDRIVGFDAKEALMEQIDDIITRAV